MKKLSTFLAIAGPFLSASVLGGVALTPGEVQSKFGNGIVFTGTDVGGDTYNIVLRPDGTATRTKKFATAADSGSWRAVVPGVCWSWGTASEQCYDIEMETAVTYDVIDSSGKVVAHWLIRLSS